MSRARDRRTVVCVAPGSLLSRAARELGLRAHEVIADVDRRLRRELPELWEDPSVARLASENISEHVAAALYGLEHAVDPGRIVQPPADADRARQLARHGTPLSSMLRAFRLGEEIVIDWLLAELPRLSDDPQEVSAAARRLNAVSTVYVDRTSERGVAVFQEERDRRLRWRTAIVNEAGMRIGTTLDIVRTTQELADLATERFADCVTVDLLDPLLHGRDAMGEGPFVLRRVALAAVDGTGPGAVGQAHTGSGPGAAQKLRTGSGPGAVEEPPAGTGPGAVGEPHTWSGSGAAQQDLHTCPDGSFPAFALATGRPARHHSDGPLDAGEVHSTLTVPLRARGTTLGVAEFVRYRNPLRFDDEDLLLAQEIAARAAVAVDNARRYTHARATALALQRSLLPRHAPRQSAVEVAYRYLPAGPEAGVGGDWYDVIPLSGARVALVVGDVVGHGIHAAATMGRLRTAVRTLADIDLPPDELLTHLDDVVLRLSAEAAADPDAEADEADYIGATCLYAVYDPVSRCCTLARAGHVPPAVVIRDGEADLLELPPGPPLGLGGLPFETVEVGLPEGSLVALYTDGLLEARDHDVDVGLTTLRELLAQPAPSLDAVCDTVLDALLTGHPDDDIALLLARTHGLGADRVATWELEADPAVVARARSDVSRQLSDWGLADLDFTAELVVSELVTNAIRYGTAPITLCLIHDRTLLCEVSDASSTTPHMRRARGFDEGGRGLLLVAQLADRWGTRHARHGKTVWAELGESAAVPAAAFG
ncbi:serine phosphatase RsbU (regulator of sigma subunit) [Streptomyces sp. Ag109_O5-1]|nr:serine phosphatase RsbU (regulator of sigma subunit) [Streptomyces sp. Ag109_O5-1]